MTARHPEVQCLLTRIWDLVVLTVGTEGVLVTKWRTRTILPVDGDDDVVVVLVAPVGPQIPYPLGARSFVASAVVDSRRQSMQSRAGKTDHQGNPFPKEPCRMMTTVLLQYSFDEPMIREMGTAGFQGRP